MVDTNAGNITILRVYVCISHTEQVVWSGGYRCSLPERIDTCTGVRPRRTAVYAVFRIENYYSSTVCTTLFGHRIDGNLLASLCHATANQGPGERTYVYLIITYHRGCTVSSLSLSPRIAVICAHSPDERHHLRFSALFVTWRLIINYCVTTSVRRRSKDVPCSVTECYINRSPTHCYHLHSVWTSSSAQNKREHLNLEPLTAAF